MKKVKIKAAKPVIHVRCAIPESFSPSMKQRRLEHVAKQVKKSMPKQNVIVTDDTIRFEIVYLP